MKKKPAISPSKHSHAVIGRSFEFSDEMDEAESKDLVNNLDANQQM